MAENNFEVRMQHLQTLERRGLDPYPAIPFHATINAERLNTDPSLEGAFVSVAGRLSAIRRYKELTFANVVDASGVAQVAVKKDQEDPDGDFETMHQNIDTGDFVGFFGHVGKSKIGTPTVWTTHMMMLTKALREAPFKVSDPEVAQRQRYLELLSDPDARARFRTRSAIVQHMRNGFLGIGTLEVETPILDNTYGGASAKPFTSYHEALGTDLYMRISPELYLKRLTSSFQEGVFEFSRNFRNEGMDRTHNPEFTTVEMYKPYWDYNNMMEFTEIMFESLALKLHGTTQVPYQDKTIDYKAPWRRLTIEDGLKQQLGIDLNVRDDDLKALGHKHLGHPQPDIPLIGWERGQVLLDLFETVHEGKLDNPTFVKDYPASTSALTKRHRDNPNLAERFELYVGGMEVGNCYTELNDPRDQRARFMAEKAKRDSGDKEAMPTDEDFILFMEYGMPLQSGIGLSIDRFTMLMTNTSHIRQAILFPTLKRK